MTQDDAPRRRPPPATGRQDRHTPPPSRTPEPEEIAMEPLPGPRGAEYYARSRNQPYGLGCLIVCTLGAAAAALVFLAIALSTTRGEEFVPSAASPPAAGPGAPQDAASPGPDAGGQEGAPE